MVTAAEQAELREELVPYGSVAEDHPEDFLKERAESPFDWDGWADEDKAHWNALEDGAVFGRLIIEKMEADTVVVKGHDRDSLKKGPGWVDYTDLPGPNGNAGISGHRTTYGAPFYRLNELQLGDSIDVYSPFRRYRYRVIKVHQVRPEDVQVLATTVEPIVTLTACDPPYSAQYRLIVHAELVEVRKLTEDTGE